MKHSPAAARRDGSASPYGFRASTQAPDDGFPFPRRHRLTRGSELQLVVREGKRIRTVHLDVRFIASPLRVSRVGIVVPRQGHSAVDRNALKRRLRELVRTQLLPALRCRPPLDALDVALRARREAYAASFEQLGSDVLTVCGRLAPAGPSDTAA